MNYTNKKDCYEKYYEKRRNYERVTYIKLKSRDRGIDNINVSLYTCDVQYDVFNKEMVVESIAVMRTSHCGSISDVILDIKEQVFLLDVDKIVFDSEELGLAIVYELLKEIDDKKNNRTYAAYGCVNNKFLRDLCTCENRVDILYDIMGSVYRHLI